MPLVCSVPNDLGQRATWISALRPDLAFDLGYDGSKRISHLGKYPISHTVLPSQHPTLRMRAYNKQWATTTHQRVLRWNALGQKPMVLWLWCSDSRIPESTLCGTQPGQDFVHRNIGNTFQTSDRLTLAVLIYAVQKLGVEHVVVVGHTSCGGIAAGLNLARQALKSKATPTTSTKQPHSGPEMLLDYLQPLQRLAQTQLKKGGPLFGNPSPALESRRLRELVRLHALHQAEKIKGTDVARDAVKSTQGKLTVDAWVTQKPARPALRRAHHMYQGIRRYFCSFPVAS